MRGEIMTVKSSTGSEKTAIILLGHGSRAAGAAEDMERVVARLKEELEYDIVDICQMSGLGDHFPEVFDRCVNRGATKIVVVPYFLHFGMHLRQDVPEMMLARAREYPHVRITLGKHLGFDNALVEVVKRRIAESDKLDDIRELKIEPVGDCPSESRHHQEVK
jgi:sirohydrochlorin ferrochelatase